MADKPKKLPLGVQTFREIIENNYLYVDKTKILADLIDTGKYFFISRPRRFGKSLLCSTLAEIFSMNKELFKGLYIYDKIKWDRHPVINISISSITYSETKQVFKNAISDYLIHIADSYGIYIKKNDRPVKAIFREVLERLAEINKVVILIDEYDKPIIDYMANLEKAKENREVLREFYGLMKDMDQYIRFVLLTGVSKFSKVSVFSGLNNLTDLTLHPEYSTLLGITQEELELNFNDHIEELLKSLSTTRVQLLDDIRFWYNGYSWDGKTRLYNPYSLLNLFSVKQFNNYWFASGTPTLLIDCIKKDLPDITKYEREQTGSYIFESYDLENFIFSSLLFQTGYLTIQKITGKLTERLYELGYPNFEVRESMLNYIAAVYTGTSVERVKPVHLKMKEALRKDDYDGFLNIVKGIFAGIPYTLQSNQNEAYYHSLFYLILSLMGAKIDLEVLTDKGRVDAVLELEDKTYIIEFKVSSAEDALKQIQDKKYYERFTKPGKPTTLLGLGGFLEKIIKYQAANI